MVFKQLQYLVALGQERHFGRAAARCNVTQPTLSAGIKQLEGELGVPIVARGQRFNGLTAEGERAVRWARQIVADGDSLKQELAAFRGGLTGRLRLGAIPATLPTISLLTSAFHRRFPGTDVTILSMTSREIERGLAEFELDAGMTYLENEPLRGVRTQPLYDEHYLLLTPMGGGFDGRITVKWAEAAELPLCLLTRDMQNRRIIDAVFERVRRKPRAAIETNSVVALCSHVRFGTWSSIVPHTFPRLFPTTEGMLQIKLVAPSTRQKIGLVVPDRTPVSPLARSLLAVARGVHI